MGFAYLRGELAELGVTLNVTSCDKHVGKVEWYMCTMEGMNEGYL